MGHYQKLLQHLLMKRGDANIPFDGLCQLLLQLGFEERIRGGHHIFSKIGVDEIINLQPKGAMSKPYQVKQVREIVLRYGLNIED
uniref:type II toxin-antitoxin system HicA family toxin n=1 Tax=Candidatus Electronema sp. TaxID=2698783 RepID=UPI00405640A2